MAAISSANGTIVNDDVTSDADGEILDYMIVPADGLVTAGGDAEGAGSGLYNPALDTSKQGSGPTTTRIPVFGTPNATFNYVTEVGSKKRIVVKGSK